MRTISSDTLTVSEAAAVLGVSRQRVLQMIAADQLLAAKIPSPGFRRFLYLISRKSLREAQRRRRRKTRTP